MSSSDSPPDSAWQIPRLASPALLMKSLPWTGAEAVAGLANSLTGAWDRWIGPPPSSHQRTHPQHPAKKSAAPATHAEAKISIRCHYCGVSHDCFDHALATVCPGCGRSILLQDVVISSSTSRLIDTRGNLTIEKTGNLYSPLTICREAVILGTLSGELHCEGRLTLQCHGLLPAKLLAEEVFVPAGAAVRCPFPVQATRVVVRGRLEANVQVRQDIHVLKRGHLIGAVWARSVQVDRGGEFVGPVRIGLSEVPQANSVPPREDFVALHPTLQGRFRRRRPRY